MYRVITANSDSNVRYEVVRNWDHPEGEWDEATIDDLHDMYQEDLNLANEEGHPQNLDFDAWLDECLSLGDCIRVKR